jgi:hypothetical protein
MPRVSKNNKFRNDTLATLYNLRNQLDVRTFNAYNSKIRNKRIDVVKRIQKELTTKYIQTIHITYLARVIGEEGTFTERQANLTILGLTKQLNKLAKKAFEDYKYQVEQESPLETKNWKYKIKETVAIEPVGIQNISMRRTMPYMLSGEVNHEWNTNKGKCVIDYLVYLWGNTKGLKKIFKEENLIQEFNTIAFDSAKITQIPIQNILKSGITINYINTFCRKYNLSYYALDDKNNCIEKYVSSNSQYKSLIFRLLNGHIYPVEDISIRKSIVSQNQDNNNKNLIATSKEVENKRKQDKADARKDNIVIYPYPYNCVGNEFILQQIKKYNKIPFPFTPANISYSEGSINHIIIDDKLILSQPIQKENGEPTHQGLMKNYVESIGIKYIGQTPITLLQQLWKEVYNEEITNHQLCSSYNPTVYNFLHTENVKFRNHYGSTNELIIDEKETIIQWLKKNPNNYDAVDIIKCYSSLLLNPLDNWIVYDSLDEIEPYQPVDGDLPFGLFVVKTEDMTILHKTNIYSNKILDYAKNQGIKFTIKYQILKKQKYKNEYLENKKFFHKIIDTLIKSNMNKSLIKLVINSITGYMGRTSHTSYKVKLNTNIQEVFEDGIIKENAKGNNIHFEKIQDIFVYGNQTKIELISNSLPIYIQILDWANIKLHQAIKKMGGICIFRHTDMALCVKTQNKSADFQDEVPETNNIFEHWGKTKREKFEHLQYKHFESFMRLDRDCKFPVLNENWNTYNDYSSSNQFQEIVELAIEKKGLLLMGRAGTGKDFVIQNGLPNLPKECKLALTNKASLIMNGTTIHKALGINDEDKACSIMIKRYKNHKIVVINEISMIQQFLWNKLCILKQRNPHLIFILIGDYRQCLPIEQERIDISDFDYFNTSIVKYLSNYNKIELTQRQRYDLDLWIMLEDFYERKIIPQLPMKQPTPTAKKICYTNRTRKLVNHQCMIKMKPSNALFIDFEDDESDFSKYKQQPIWLYNHLPVMSIVNNKKYELINGNEYFIKYFDENIFILDDDTEIPTKNFHTYFVVNYISTTHKLQGQTINDDLYIYDFDKLVKDKHIGYTAFSRVKHLKQLYISHI